MPDTYTASDGSVWRMREWPDRSWTASVDYYQTDGCDLGGAPTREAAIDAVEEFIRCHQ